MNRIVDYPEATSLTDNDYVLIDNSSNGAKCIKASALNINMENFTINEARGAIASFDDGEDLPLAFMGAYIEPVQSGSGDPSPSNIRPISGWDEVNVTVADDITNKSFFDGLMNGTYGVVDLGSLTWSHASSNRSISNAIANIIKKPATQTSLSNLLTSNGYTEVPSNTSLNTNGQFAITQSGEMIFYYDGVNEPKGYMVYELATPTTPTVTPSEINELYEEFGINGHTYEINLGDTRYGGTLDVVSGVLTVDRVNKTYVGASNENWIAIGLGFYIEELTMQSGAYKNGLSNWIKTAHSYDDENGMSIVFGTQYQVIKTNHIKDNISGITDVASWKTYLASNNLTVNYPLATPFTVQLPPSAVVALEGENNISADSGNVVVAYRKHWNPPTM